MSDEFPDLVAMFDQALVAMGNVAKLLHAYHVQLVREGFTEDQALFLTAQYQQRLLTETG
jgi:hypothetical protein